MSVTRIDEATIELRGICPLEDVEPLLRHLFAAPKSKVDWRACDFAHTAVVQVLLVAKAHVLGPPRGEFLRNMVDPLFSHL
jgi:hypothetical protein